MLVVCSGDGKQFYRINRIIQRVKVKYNETCTLTEQTRTHGAGVYIDSKGGDVVLSFGQLVQESHNV